AARRKPQRQQQQVQRTTRWEREWRFEARLTHRRAVRTAAQVARAAELFAGADERPYAGPALPRLAQCKLAAADRPACEGRSRLSKRTLAGRDFSTREIHAPSVRVSTVRSAPRRDTAVSFS